MLKKILLTLSIFHDELLPWLMKLLETLLLKPNQRSQLLAYVVPVTGAISVFEIYPKLLQTQNIKRV